MTFSSRGTTEMPMPRIEVEGAGVLSFPVPGAQIAAIVGKAERAPYGRGRDTIVDTSVRNVWQIAPGKIKISGKSWAANFETILSKVKAGLGCGDAMVSAELYKLLVYDRGGFFLAHRDTEKRAGMFGTLVVTLPSTYRGGELRIRHAGREVTVDTNILDPSELSYVAFYADCEHEVLPVREGNRLCLIYNLIQKNAKGRRRILKAPEYESQISEAAAILERFLTTPNAPAKIAWLLEHQYSPAGLSFSALKGADAAKARESSRRRRRARSAPLIWGLSTSESPGGRTGRRPFMDRAGIVTGITTAETRRTLRKTTRKKRASPSPQSMTPGSTSTNGATRDDRAVGVWPHSSCRRRVAPCRRARPGASRRKAADRSLRQ